MRAVQRTGDPKETPDRRGLSARLRDPHPRDTALLAEADLYLRRSLEDEEVKEADERLPSLDESKWRASDHRLSGT